MAKYGLEIAEQGASVDTAADYQFILNTSWPLLRVAAAGSFTIPGNDLNFHTIYQHNLGFFPPFVIYENGDTNTKTGQSATDGYNGFYCDTTRLSIFSGTGITSYTGYFIIFDYDISKTFNSNTFANTQMTQDKTSLGFEVAAKNHNLLGGSQPSFTTKNRPMAVHMSGPITTDSNGKFQLVHGLGYFPSYFVYGPSQTGISPVEAKVTATQNSIAFAGVQSPLAGTYYYLILKDPILGAI